MWKHALAVLAGYGSLAVLTMVSVAALAKIGGLEMGRNCEELPPLWFTIAVLTTGIGCAAAGGWVCARIAPGTGPSTVAVLGGIVLVLGFAMALSPDQPGPSPSWYRYSLPVVGAIGVLLGGFLSTPR